MHWLPQPRLEEEIIKRSWSAALLIEMKASDLHNTGKQTQPQWECIKRDVNATRLFHDNLSLIKQFQNLSSDASYKKDILRCNMGPPSWAGVGNPGPGGHCMF